MKYQKIIACVLLCFVLLTACAPALETEPAAEEKSETEATEVVVQEPTAQESVEIVVWNTWSDHHVEIFNAIIDDFNASHPNITVVQQPQPLADFDAKVMQAVRSGEGPDFLITTEEVASNYIKDDLIVNLDTYLNDEAIGIPGFEEMVTESTYKTITQWDGTVRILPVTVTSEVLYYNKTIYDDLGLSVPTTWEELEQNGRIITESTGKPSFGFDSIIDGYIVLIEQNGSDFVDPETMTVLYNNPIAVEQLEWFSGLVDEGVFRLVGEDVYFSNPFGSQAVASFIGSPAGYGFVQSAVDGQFEFDVAPIPQSGIREYVSPWGLGSIVFKTTEAKQRAAFEFSKYLITPEILAQWCVEYGHVPAYPEGVQQPIFQEYVESNPAIRASAAQMDKAGYLPAVQGSAALRTIIGRAVISASSGVLTPEEALNAAEQEGNLELQQYQ